MTQQTNLPAFTDQETIFDAFLGDTDLDLLAHTAGLDLAMAVLKHFAGFVLHVPKTIYWDHPIAEAIGFENAQRLAEYAGGGRLCVPTRHPAQKSIHDAEITRRVYARETRAEIARAIGMSQRNVRRIISRLGLSGISFADRGRKSAPIPPESDFNGGLTGVSASSTTLDRQEAPQGAQSAIHTKFGIYAPQAQTEQL